MDLSAAAWRKSSHSGDNQGMCVEIAAVHKIFAIRDSRDPEGAKLILSLKEARSLSKRVKGY